MTGRSKLAISPLGVPRVLMLFGTLFALAACSGGSGEDQTPDAVVANNSGAGDAGSTTGNGDTDAGDSGPIVRPEDMSGASGGAGVWCPAHDLSEEYGSPVEFSDLGSTGERLHAVGSCDGAGCWFVGAVSDSGWQTEQTFVDDRGQGFVDVGCSLEWCVGATGGSLFASDGTEGLELTGPDRGDSGFVASSVGPARIVAAGSNSEVWLMRGEPVAETGWQLETPGTVRDFAGTGASLRYAVGEQVWELGADDVWTVTDFAEDVNHAAVAGDTLFLTGGTEYIAVNTGFTQTATVTVELGRVAAFDRLGDTSAIITADDRLLYSTGRQPSNMPVGIPPSAEFVGVAYTLSGTPWALTRDGVVYGWQDVDSCESL